MSTTAKPPFLVERNPGYFEYQLPISVKLVIDVDGMVPLLKNERNEWELPGGKLEVGEPPEVCVAREVHEELGLTVTVDSILDNWVYEITPQRHVFIVTYGAVYSGSETPRASNEHKELGLFAYDQVRDLVMPEQYKTSIEHWQARTPSR
jgi:mutator protein MutT